MIPLSRPALLIAALLAASQALAGPHRSPTGAEILTPDEVRGLMAQLALEDDLGWRLPLAQVLHVELEEASGAYTVQARVGGRRATSRMRLVGPESWSMGYAPVISVSDGTGGAHGAYHATRDFAAHFGMTAADVLEAWRAGTAAPAVPDAPVVEPSGSADVPPTLSPDVLLGTPAADRLQALGAERTLRFTGQVAGGGRLPQAVLPSQLRDVYRRDGVWHAVVSLEGVDRSFAFRRLERDGDRVDPADSRLALTDAEAAAEPEAIRAKRLRLVALRGRIVEPKEGDVSGALAGADGHPHRLSSVDLTDLVFHQGSWHVTVAGETHRFLVTHPATGVSFALGEAVSTPARAPRPLTTRLNGRVGPRR